MSKTLPTLDFREPKRPLVLQGERHNLSVLDVDRRIRGDIEFVPPAERLRPQRERHLEVVARRWRRYMAMVGGVWVVLDKVADEDAGAFEPPVADMKAL